MDLKSCIGTECESTFRCCMSVVCVSLTRQWQMLMRQLLRGLALGLVVGHSHEKWQFPCFKQCAC